MSLPSAATLGDHRYLWLFLAVLVDQLGLPFPAAPVLFAAGIMVRNGYLEPEWVVLLSMLASLIGHGAWYLAGRRHGASIIRLLCNLSLDPQSCVRRTEELFKHVGPTSLLWVRFIIGLDALAQPMVAMAGMPLFNYVIITLSTAAIWASTLVGAGYLLAQTSPQALLETAARPLLVTTALAVVAYVAIKYLLYLISGSRDVPRMGPQSLHQLLQTSRPVVLIDLRTPSELRRSGQHISGAKHLSRRALRKLIRAPEPATVAVVMCDCPKEAGSAYTAAVMRRHGWSEVWALTGGFAGWRKAGLPTSALTY